MEFAAEEDNRTRGSHRVRTTGLTVYIDLLTYYT